MPKRRGRGSYLVSANFQQSGKQQSDTIEVRCIMQDDKGVSGYCPSCTAVIAVVTADNLGDYREVFPQICVCMDALDEWFRNGNHLFASRVCSMT